ncbi:MAG: hypothetical protein KAX38_00605, partial [Candidatus Krumholzibacteria bacterium]|nr:hypothetical protein [Candidatus Krumholzibacteria bacterium]
TFMLATGGKGQYIGRLALSLGGTGEIEYGRMRLVPLVDEMKIHDGVKEIFGRYGLELTEKERKKK